MIFYYTWEQRKLSELLEVTSEKNTKGQFTQDDILACSLGTELDKKTIFFGLRSTEESVKSYRVVNIGDVIYTKSPIKGYPNGIVRTCKNTDGIVPSLYCVYREKDNISIPIDTRFIQSYLEDKTRLDGYLSPLVNVGARNNVNITDKGFLEGTIMLPKTKEEQIRIVDTLTTISDLITLHQRKCDQTKKLKKYMLQKMFPQNGELYPEIRFEGFTNAWKQCKLSDAIEKLTGGASIAPEDYTEEGYRTIPKGAVNDSGVADMSGCKYVSGTFFAKNSTSKTSAGELVTSLRDLVPTAPNIGRIVRIYGDSEEFLMPQGVYSIKVKDNVSEDFLITYSNSPIYRKIIMAEKNGSTQVHIRNGEFLNIDFPMPSCDEQNKIGSYFRNLNNLITLHQRKRDELMKIKKYMLQNMFAM